jgi:DNA-binding NarL/FixJ family response regulator
MAVLPANGMRRVLIVDDHPGFRRCARALLDAEGFEVVGEAGDAATAVAVAMATVPDLVLLDVQLPGEDGFEVAARLLAHDASVRIVLVSSRARSDYGPLVDRSGAIGFVSKEELSVERLERMLE